MSDANEFGKDLGLMHEVVITGRKAGVDPSAYSMLAHSPEWFQRFGKLLEHLDVLRRTNTPLAAVSVVKVKEFLTRLMEIINASESGCISCDFGSRYKVARQYVPEPVFKEADEKIERMAPELRADAERSAGNSFIGYFWRWLADEVTALGLHPEELPLLLGMEYIPVSKYHRTHGLKAQSCIPNEKISQCLLQLVEQRNLLVELEGRLEVKIDQS